MRDYSRTALRLELFGEVCRVLSLPYNLPSLTFHMLLLFEVPELHL